MKRSTISIEPNQSQRTAPPKRFSASVDQKQMPAPWARLGLSSSQLVLPPSGRGVQAGDPASRLQKFRQTCAPVFTHTRPGAQSVTLGQESKAILLPTGKQA